MNAWPIGIFDSGAGGLSVLSSCRALLPYEDFIYLSDASHAPYGNKTDGEIAERVFACCERLMNLNCKAIVVACNTATGVGIKMLRQRYARPFVGLEPAMKPAVKAGIAGEIVILCTEATARQEKFLALLKQCVSGQLSVVSWIAAPMGRNVIKTIPSPEPRTPNPGFPPTITVAPQKKLAALIEIRIDNLESIRPQVYEILTPYKDAAAVILGCTHYVFIREMIADFYRLQDRKIPIFDGNAGAARRLKGLLKKGQLLTNRKTAGGVRLILG